MGFFQIRPLTYEYMSFKVVFFFYYWLLWPFCSAERNDFSSFGRGSPNIFFCNYFEIGPLAYMEILFKVVFCLTLVAILFSERNDLNMFGRGSLKDHFCEIILKSGY